MAEQPIREGFLSSADAMRILRVSGNTLRTWDREGKIETTRADYKRSHRRYNVKKFIESSRPHPQPPVIDRKRIIYARVSTRNQSDNLKRQIECLRTRFPDHELVQDIGSGINFKRKGLDSILDLAFKKELEEVVVAYKDRLCRFGFELYERLFKELSNAKIVVLDERDCSPNEEMAEDILTVVTVFSARINGRKRYTKKDEQVPVSNDLCEGDHIQTTGHDESTSVPESTGEGIH